MIERIIQSLDLKVDYIVVAIEESKNLDFVNIGQLIMKSLHVHGQRLRKIKTFFKQKLTLKKNETNFYERSHNNHGY